MPTLIAQSLTYHCAETPSAGDGDVGAAIAAALAAWPHPEPPQVLYWDLVSDDPAVAAVRLGRGGLDTYLLSRPRMGHAVAIEQSALADLGMTGDEGASAFASGAARLLRAPTARSLHIAEVQGRLEPRGTAFGAPKRIGAPDSVSIVVLVNRPDQSVLRFLDAVAGQQLSARSEIVVMLSGPDPIAVRDMSESIGAWRGGDNAPKVKRYALAGEMDRAYLANTGAALSTGDVVIFADPACLPQSPGALQALSEWAWSAGVASASPTIYAGETLMAAGLGLIGEPSDVEKLRVFDQPVFSNRLRLTAAPSPWLFATQRQRWIASGGARSLGGALWTAPLAGRAGPAGRHVLLGFETALWAASPPADLDAEVAAPINLRQASAAAMRLDTNAARDDATLHEPSPLQPVGRTTAVSRVNSGIAAFADERARKPGALSLLVFADRFGPSQSIAFIDGLASARRSGAVSVQIVAEAAAAVDLSAIPTQFSLASPDIVVVSRLADPEVWRVVRATARAQGLPIVFHIDDDLFDAPVHLGIERYRLARHPRRLHTLHDILTDCDLALAASPVLADRLRAMTSGDHVAVMPSGSGAVPPAVRPAVCEGRLRIGYMGSASHDRDLAMIAPALNRVTAAFPNVELILFGSIAGQPAARLLDHPVTRVEPVEGDYSAFRRRLAELRLDIGLAPLADTPFNRAKTATKWIEYAEAGVAVIASRVDPYLPAAAAGALVAVNPDEWEAGLRQLLESPALRRRLVDRADQALRMDFGWDRLENGMLGLLNGLRSRKEAA